MLTHLLRAKLPPARARARSRTAIADLLTRPDVALRERTLWALLYESAARAREILPLDVADLDRPGPLAEATRSHRAPTTALSKTHPITDRQQSAQDPVPIQHHRPTGPFVSLWCVRSSSSEDHNPGQDHLVVGLVDPVFRDAVPVGNEDFPPVRIVLQAIASLESRVLADGHREGGDH